MSWSCVAALLAVALETQTPPPSTPPTPEQQARIGIDAALRKETLGGFFLIEAKDVQDAIAIAAKWPSGRIGSIEVRPIEEELRMDRRYCG